MTEEPPEVHQGCPKWRPKWRPKCARSVPEVVPEVCPKWRPKWCPKCARSGERVDFCRMFHKLGEQDVA